MYLTADSIVPLFLSLLLTDRESLVSSITALFADDAQGDTEEATRSSLEIHRSSLHLEQEPTESISLDELLRFCQTVFCFKEM